MFIEFHNGKYFLTNGIYYYFCNEGEIYYSKKYKSHFYFENSLLKWRDYYISYNENNDHYKLCISKESTKCVNVKIENYDIRPYAYGSNAFIYFPSLSGSDKKITRILKNIAYYNPVPEDKIECLRDFCNFPLETRNFHKTILEEYFFGINNESINKFIVKNGLEHFLKKFYNIIKSTLLFEKIGFFHGDISKKNIIYIDETFKFIDFDAHLFTENLLDCGIFLSGIIHPVYPILVNIIIINYISSQLRKKIDLNYSNNDILKYSSFYRKEFSGHPLFINMILRGIDINLIRNNPILTKKYDKEKINSLINYVTIYQITIVFLQYVSVFKDELNRKVYYDFSSEILNVENNCENPITPEYFCFLYEKLFLNS